MRADFALREISRTATRRLSTHPIDRRLPGAGPNTQCPPQGKQGKDGARYPESLRSRVPRLGPPIAKYPFLTGTL